MLNANGPPKRLVSRVLMLIANDRVSAALTLYRERKKPHCGRNKKNRQKSNMIARIKVIIDSESS